jgi:hypothetical protein
MSAWITGIASGFFGLLGLVLAAKAVDTGMSVFGFALFGFGILMIFWILKTEHDAADRARAARQ